MSTHNLSQDQCPVCRYKFANVYLKRRHIGVIHGLCEDGQTISAERREYLRHQSDRKYVRNRDRRHAGNPPTPTVVTSPQQSFDYTAMNRSKRGKVECVDPTALESSDESDEDNECKMFQQMMTEYERAHKRVCRRKPKKSPLPEYTETLQWTKY